MFDHEEARKILLTEHRYLFPERHEGFWNAVVSSEHPQGWVPGEKLLWDASSIEHAAQAIEEALTALGGPVDEDMDGAR